ncbi:MAG: IPT/TIG domain-containing protein [Dehalococcoidia bacterium]|nr:IPT/TIG domain-containing protein [Dehalococcoidia bacterium]
MATNSMTLDPNYGPIGTEIYAKGHLDGTSSYAYIRFGSSTNTANQIRIYPDSSGDWEDFIEIPEGLGGAINIYAVRTTSSTASGTISQSYSRPFYITPRITSIDPEEGPIGTVITIAGDGFSTSNSAPSLYVYIDGNSVTPISNGAISTSNGKLSNLRIEIPSGLTRGKHYITIEDRRNSNGEASEEFGFSVTAGLTVNPTSGSVGDTVELVGTGFAGGNVSIYFDDQFIKQTTVPSSGTNAGYFSTTIEIPATSPGAHTIEARTNSGSATATFTINQQITISPLTAISVGEDIKVTGSGFGPSQAVVISLDGVQISITPAPYSSSSGAFEVTFPLPAATKGEHTIRAQVGNGTPSTATINVTSNVTLSTNSASPGETIAISGTGFTPGSADVTLGGVQIGTATVDNSGSFTNAPITIPNDASFGTHNLFVQGESAGTFTVDPKLAVSPASGGPDDTITISGSGFRPNKTMTFQLGEYSLAAIQGTVTTDAFGGFEAAFKIPFLPKGQYIVQATDGNNSDTERKSGSAQININQTINTLSSYSGQAGEQVYLTGAGFAANRAVTISFGNQVVGTVNSNAWGYFGYDPLFVFEVPSLPAGNITITASDGTNSATATFALQTSVVLDQSATNADPAWVGMNMGVTGGGFRANSSITITFDSDPAVVATTSATAQGSFSTSIQVPPLTAGAHKMRISDGTTTHELDFVIENTAPSAPVLLKPALASKPKQPVEFTWEAVADPSGVTYEFQLSQDETFEVLILEQLGISSTTLTLPDDPKLPSASGSNAYQWRVRAVDGAGNVGDWSPASTFNIGFIWPSWLIHVWYSLGIIIALVLGLWLGRRMAYQSY